MSLAVVVEGMTLIAYLVILAGGKQRREAGWKVLSGLLLGVGVIECAAMAIIVSLASPSASRSVGTHGLRFQAYLYEHDNRFFPGWQLDSSWILCTVSWSVMILLSAAVTTAALLLPSEGGYELIPGEH